MPAVILREVAEPSGVKFFSDSNAFDLNGDAVARINGEAVRIVATPRVMQPKAARNAVSSVAQSAKVTP